MRAALWFIGLFGIAVAVALFAGNNQGTITVFWPPYRIDLSLNMVLLILFGGFTVVHLALRALAALLDLPVQAGRWRNQQKERHMHVALLDGLSHLTAGRYIRARKAAETAIVHEKALVGTAEPLAHAVQVRALAHLIAAESAHALQDRPARDRHLQQALEQTAANPSAPAQEAREGAQLRAASWAMQDRDALAALGWLEQLPQGAARRTAALRTRLRASRLAGQTQAALDTARLLIKHRAFSATAAHSIVRGLAIELINQAHDTGQLLKAWQSLDASDRAMPELAVHAAERLHHLGGDAVQARAWLLPAWETLVNQPGSLADALEIKLVRALEGSLIDVDPPWLARIESAQQNNPRDPLLQYLAGIACLRLQLWGKAQKLLEQASKQLPHEALRCRAWRALADLAEQRGDMEASARAWRRAAELSD
ncbi:heme biosynthesis protein HemY [Xylophilus sp. GOD-11R]|uniref:heme biosynthesis protein HemY n=1 Tax=Xylophilus sp. GOD-11R TaxID=3089814 RepID=UPI00298D39B6|nr:heme biosynthesis HemY N-terminal domain-containing protein [Xylophilus sp. GOD-11R]WPB58053.1 heme biosynthesis HemY N-terminal domain-containing protein [Xylophilus sp. GOD-11R]